MTTCSKKATSRKEKSSLVNLIYCIASSITDGKCVIERSWLGQYYEANKYTVDISNFAQKPSEIINSIKSSLVKKGGRLENVTGLGKMVVMPNECGVFIEERFDVHNQSSIHIHVLGNI